MFYLVQRMDAEGFQPGDHIDLAYADMLFRAMAAGVEVLVYDTRIDLSGIRLGQRLPFVSGGTTDI